MFLIMSPNSIGKTDGEYFLLSFAKSRSISGDFFPFSFFPGVGHIHHYLTRPRGVRIMENAPMLMRPAWGKIWSGAKSPATGSDWFT